MVNGIKLIMRVNLLKYFVIFILIINSEIIHAKGSSTGSSSGRYIEPYLGGMVGEFDQPITNVTPVGTLVSSSGDLTGWGVGSKIGAAASIFFSGLDFLYSESTWKYNLLGGTASSKTTTSNTVGNVFLGLDIPFIPRLWVGYNFYDHLKIHDTAELQDDRCRGNGMKAGIGFGSTIRLNIEGTKSTYNVCSGDKLPMRYQLATYSMTADELSVTTLLASLSVPFSF